MSVFEAVKPQIGPSYGAYAPQPHSPAFPQPFPGGQAPYGPAQLFGAFQQPQMQQPHMQNPFAQQYGVHPMVADAATKLAPLMIGVVAEALRAEPQTVSGIHATGQIPPQLYPVVLMEAANRIAPILHAVLALQPPQFGQQPYGPQQYQHPFGPQQPYGQQQPFGPQQYQQPPFAQQQYPLMQQQQPFAPQQYPFMQQQPFGPQQQPAFPGR